MSIAVNYHVNYHVNLPFVSRLQVDRQLCHIYEKGSVSKYFSPIELSQLMLLHDLPFSLSQEGKLNKLEKGKKGKRKIEREVDGMDPLEYYEAVKLLKKKKKEAREAVFR